MDQQLDEAFLPFSTFVEASSDLDGELISGDSGIVMTMESVEMDMPIEMDLSIDEDGSVVIGPYRQCITWRHLSCLYFIRLS